MDVDIVGQRCRQEVMCFFRTSGADPSEEAYLLFPLAGRRQFFFFSKKGAAYPIACLGRHSKVPFNPTGGVELAPTGIPQDL